MGNQLDKCVHPDFISISRTAYVTGEQMLAAKGEVVEVVMVVVVVVAATKKEVMEVTVETAVKAVEISAQVKNLFREATAVAARAPMA